MTPVKKCTLRELSKKTNDDSGALLHTIKTERRDVTESRRPAWPSYSRSRSYGALSFEKLVRSVSKALDYSRRNVYLYLKNLNYLSPRCR
jgi:hypothetical protein